MREKFGCNSVDNDADGLYFEIVMQVGIGSRKELTMY
jgi:hypothetical protein